MMFQGLMLLFPAALLSVAASQLMTFKATDPTTGTPVECDRCPPGTYLLARCTSTQRSQCAACPAGSFTELWNHISKCLRCGVCGQNQVVKTACTANSDCQCQCKQGYYYREDREECLPHSRCPTGQGVLTQGTADEDTVCQICSNGTFSDTVSSHQNCTEHKHCHAAGMHLVVRGSTWHDNMYTTCEEHNSRDGAEYLREILPTFFVHHQIPIRRLRRIVQKLPSKDGSRHAGTSGLSTSALNEQLNAWVASATAKQIRQLPDILTKAGANSAGDRLHNKLQRIDSNVAELCASRNDVHVVFMAE
ncbi:tumor necrosis factor receptor superfamily member 6B-like [Morone saxatilis]|uniref:tumor necrosis factor receptor superfamily member 6B-like n=1 Tax=Morone saxatilis TaxID=34816 RepID=UPI0015E24370|nr:tumor necrosis factor receptor superfamily member 6B-like [Morone saxatilis]